MNRIAFSVRTLAATAAGLTLTALAAVTAAPAGTTAVTPIDAPGLKSQIDARRGKVVVVNFWATWCAPCVSEFPSLVKLYNSQKAKGLDLVTVSFDEKNDAAKKVIPFLVRQKLSSGTFINKGGVDLDDSYLKMLEPKLPSDEQVAIPRTYIFDRKGKLVRVLTNAQSYETFLKAVAPLLSKK